MHFGCVNVILLHCNHRHVLATRGHHEGGEKNNKCTITVCHNHSIVTKHIIFG
jgi:hypothetical protein